MKFWEELFDYFASIRHGPRLKIHLQQSFYTARTWLLNYCIATMGLERGPLSLVSTTEELLDRKVAAPV
jgi:hypothetical protein